MQRLPLALLQYSYDGGSECIIQCVKAEGASYVRLRSIEGDNRKRVRAIIDVAKGATGNPDYVEKQKIHCGTDGVRA